MLIRIKDWDRYGLKAWIDGERVIISNTPGTLGTFSPNVYTVCERTSDAAAFPLTRTGWGTFTIGIKVELKNGSMLRLRHQLSFAEAPAGLDRQVRLTNTAERLSAQLWRWTAFIEAPENVLEEVLCVEYTLHETFPNPIREVCIKGNSTQPFALSETGWGTFNLKGRVRFRDGKSLAIERYLDFSSAR